MLSLVVSDGTNESPRDFVAVFVDENLLPVAIATATPTLGDPPLTVQFDGSTSYDHEGATLTYCWDFGDASAPSTDGTVRAVAVCDRTAEIVTTEEGSRNYVVRWKRFLTRR